MSQIIVQEAEARGDEALDGQRAMQELREEQARFLTDICARLVVEGAQAAVHLMLGERAKQEPLPTEIIHQRKRARIAFVRQPNGRFYIYSSGAAAGFQQVPFMQSTVFYTWLRYFTIGVFVLVLVLWPVSALVRRHYRQPLNRTGMGLQLHSWVRIVCMVDGAVLLGWYYYFNALGLTRTDRSLDGALTVLHIAGWIGAIGTILVILNALASWTSENRLKLSRLGDTMMALGCIGFVWSEWLCNFLRWGTKF